MNHRQSKKILFANFPGDGHFNPLTGIAVYLKELGYDVRWYSSALFEEKINRLGIPYYPFKKALEIKAVTIDELFPLRKQIKGKIGKMNHDLQEVFIKRGPEYYEDILGIYESFPFDLLISDCMFTGNAYVKEKMKIPVLAMGIIPLAESSKDLAPTGLGLHPATSFAGRIRQALLRWTCDRVLFKKSIRMMHGIFAEYNIPHHNVNFFDMLVKQSTLYLQSGTPGFEYYRSDLSEQIRFIGPLMAHSKQRISEPWFNDKVNKYERIVLVTQGTVENDVNKLLIPTLEAFRDSNFLVVATTSGNNTQVLRDRFNDDNYIIEDFIPFTDIMPYSDVYITNGGYGGVMLGIENHLPMVVAGIHEGKNEINARIGFFRLGVDLRTEWPTAVQIRSAVDKVLFNNGYRKNVQALSREFNSYNPNTLTAGFVQELLLSNAYKTIISPNALVY
jgi:MGT family glycosyltransferase